MINKKLNSRAVLWLRRCHKTFNSNPLWPYYSVQRVPTLFLLRRLRSPASNLYAFGRNSQINIRMFSTKLCVSGFVCVCAVHHARGGLHTRHNTIHNLCQSLRNAVYLVNGTHTHTLHMNKITFTYIFNFYKLKKNIAAARLPRNGKQIEYKTKLCVAIGMRMRTC